MVMDKGLIVREYEQSRDKNAQIAILADLNGCSVDEIMNVLMEAGVISGMPKAKAKRAESVKWTPELDAEVQKLAREGLTQLEIGERLGISKQSIADRRSYLKKQAEKLAGRLDKEKKKCVLPQSLRDSSLPEGALKKEKSPPKKEVYGVLREIIEMLATVGLEVTECNINVLERSFVISGIEIGEDI